MSPALAPDVDVLLVEDNRDDAEFARRALARALPQLRVSTVDDGARALEFLACEGEFSDRAGLPPPRFVLLDLKLPKVDGLQVVQRVKSDPATRSVPIVVLTSSREPRDLEACYAAGANSFVVKPVNFEEYTRALGDVARYWITRNQVPWGGPAG